MIQYSYRGYILEMRLVGEASSIRVKGTIKTHPSLTFYDEYIPRMKKQFNSLVGRESL